MPKILEVLRLHAEANLSDRAIARSLTMSHATVGSILRRAEAAGISCPLPEDYVEAQRKLVISQTSRKKKETAGAQLEPYISGIQMKRSHTVTALDGIQGGGT